jgi:hypothetical protein
MDNTTQLTPEQKAEKKREYMRNYMRSWKQKKYAENPEKVLRANRSRYLAKEYKPTEEEKKKYGVFLHTVVKARKYLDELQRDRPELVNDVLMGANIPHLL